MMKKRIFALTATLMLAANLFAQAPEKMSYQAVVRNADSELLSEETVGMQISILQGAVDGEAVYVETQTPTTNTNGLISLQIGEGTVVSGSFSTIDWGTGPYFLKTETDPTGGTSYTIEGVSELMSVPYAFYSSVADSIAGGVTEEDPIFTESVAAGITDLDIANWNDHTDSTDIAEFGYVAGLKTYEVGDFAQGGIVFWVDESKQHGLVCTKEEIGSLRWHAGTYAITRANGGGVYSGESNTLLIIPALLAAGDDGGDYAAVGCNTLEVTEDDVTYGDWYLPSSDELEIIGLNRLTIDATALDNDGTAIAFSPYWTSNEISPEEAGAKLMTPDGVSDITTNKNATFNVRAVRSF